MRFAIKLKVVAGQRQKDEGRRATFTNAEWNVLTRNLLSWAEGKGKYAADRNEPLFININASNCAIMSCFWQAQAFVVEPKPVS